MLLWVSLCGLAKPFTQMVSCVLRRLVVVFGALK